MQEMFLDNSITNNKVTNSVINNDMSCIGIKTPAL